MKKIQYWMLAAAIICGSSLFTACSDNDDNPVTPADEEAKKVRTELVAHIKNDTELLAENLTTDGLSVTTQINTQLMTLMGKGRNLMANMKQLISMMAIKNAVANVKAVSPGSELQKMGYKAYIAVDISSFGIRVVMDERGNYNVTPANGLEFVFPASVEGVGTTIYKISFKNSGKWYESVPSPAKMGNVKGLACVFRIPTAMTMTLSGLFDNKEVALLTGVLNIEPEKVTEAGYVSLEDNILQLSGQIASFMQGYGLPDNDECLQFNFDINKGKVADSDFLYTQKGQKLFHITSNTAEETSDLQIDILEDLLISGIISNKFDLQTLQDLIQYMKDGKLTDEEFQAYVQAINEQCKLSIACQPSGSQVPMRLVAEQMEGYPVILPAFKFADKPDYIPLGQLLDEETMNNFNSICSSSITSLSSAVDTYKQLFASVMQMMPMNGEEWGF